MHNRVMTVNPGNVKVIVATPLVIKCLKPPVLEAPIFLELTMFLKLVISVDLFL